MLLRHVSVRRLGAMVGLATFFGLAMSQAARVQAQPQANFEKVRFSSVDGVDLYGAFHAAGKRTAPTVLLLHALKDDDSNKKSWIDLADALQKGGFNVLRFDFRGHGQSKDIDPDLFWRFKHNSLVKGGPKKSSIEYKDMASSYYPCLVNDIMAAKAFLDFRHDAGSCNTQSLFVIGAETGATLGGIWLNAEWHRHRFEPPMMFQPGQIVKRPEGKDVIGCVWLSPSAKLGLTRPLMLSKLYDIPGRVGATPMVFMYSDGDSTGKTIAKGLENALKGTKKSDKELYRYTAAVEVKGGGKLTGAGLLQKSLGTQDAVVEYLKSVAEAKAVDWVERDFRRNEYVWVVGGGTPLQAKSKTEKSFVYDSFERFIPR